MLDDFIRELETLTHQHITPTPTEIGFLLPVNATLIIHFIVLDKLHQSLDLPEWKANNNLTNTISIFENEWTLKKEH
jgi:hypothetical protein